MTHHKETTGSIRTMRRTLMGGAIVSSLFIASLAPASAGCLYPQVRINAQIVDYSNTQSKQLGVNWSSATGSQNTGANLRWAPTDDLRVNSRYGGFRQERPEPQANRGGRGTFRGSNRVGTRYDTPRLGAVVLPQAQIRYRNEFGGMGTEGNQNLLWGQGLNSFQPNVNQANQVSRVNVRGYAPNGLSKIPLLGAFRDRTTANTRSYRRELIINVTPRIVPTNER